LNIAKSERKKMLATGAGHCDWNGPAMRHKPHWTITEDGGVKLS
jgi:hypothetical protein